MKFLSDSIDRFCYKHPRFGIQNLMLILVACTGIVYVLDMVSQYSLSPMLYFSRSLILQGQVWRLITFVIVPGSYNIILLAISLYFYYFIGTHLEREWGTGKFTIYYLLGVVLTIISGLCTGSASTTYINLSLFLAFATLYPNLRVMLFYIIPVKTKWLGWLDAALLAYSFVSYLIQGYWQYALLVVVGVLNYLIFFWSDLMYYVRRGKRTAERQTVQFKRAAQQKKEQTGYLHKCAVCGRTDADYPNLEFRYCSRCVGNYCYCMDHINTHVHITE